MLFEKEPLTPQGKADVLARLFCSVATRVSASEQQHGSVPREVLEAYGDLSTHVRFMIEAAAHVKRNNETKKQLRKIEKLLDALPECIMHSLEVGPNGNWMQLYRKLVQLHGLLEDALPTPDAEEYTAILQKLIRMAETVAEHAAVHINAASMFTLLMMQVHLHKYSPSKKKSPRRRKNSKTGSKKA